MIYLDYKDYQYLEELCDAFGFPHIRINKLQKNAAGQDVKLEGIQIHGHKFYYIVAARRYLEALIDDPTWGTIR